MPTKQQLALDIVQFALDMVGIVDPTGTADAMSGLISLGQGKWLDAAISGVSMIPYLGDLAKTAKLPKYLRSIQEAVELAAKDAEFAARLRPALQKIKDTLDRVPLNKLPQEGRAQLERIQREISNFLHTGSRRKYSSNPKHEAAGVGGRKGSPMDLQPLEAEELLNDARNCLAVPGKRQFVGVKNGKIYAFQDDGAGGFHAYVISGNEVFTKYSKIAKDIASLLGTDIKRLSRMD